MILQKRRNSEEKAFILSGVLMIVKGMLKTFVSKNVLETFVLRYVTRRRARYYGVGSGDECGTTGSFRILQCRLRHTEGVNGRKIRAPKISFGVTKERDDNLVMTSKHKKVIIERSCGFMHIDVGPMGQES